MGDKFKDITKEDGKKLIELSRESIKNYLEKGEELSVSEPEEIMKEKMGTFVTLKKFNSAEDKTLRGCMGIPRPRKSLIDSVIDSAINSATKDPRFPQLNPKELNDVVLEISILSKPEEINIENREDLSSEIEVGRDGLIIEGRLNSGLLLPTVPIEHDWDEKEFLDHTCRKAGLQDGCWKNKDNVVKRFSGIVFAEKSPKGTVERVF